MSRAVRLAAALTLSSALALLPAQGAPVQGSGPLGGAPVPAPAIALRHFDVAAAAVQDVTLLPGPSGSLIGEVELGGVQRVLHLFPHDVRAPGFRLLLRDAQGERPAPLPPSVTFRGAVAGDPAAIVAAGCWDLGLRAVVRLGDGAEFGIAPLRSCDPTATPARHVVWSMADARNLAVACGTAHQAGVPAATGGPDNLTICEFAIDADHAFFQFHGNATAVHNDVTTLLNAVDAAYQNDLQITHLLTGLVVWTGPDPYTTIDPTGLLAQFAAWWNANQGGVPRDLAHLLTGRNLQGLTVGLAYVGSVCGAGAYGLSETTYTNNFNLRTKLMAHEMGHGWGANHCDGDPDCGIMCSSPGCGSSGFGSRSRAVIGAFRATRNCLQFPNVAPAITAVTPATVGSFQPVEVTLTGSAFNGASAVQIGPVTIPRAQFALIDDRTIRVTPPRGLPIGSAAVTVTNAAGTSPAVGLGYTAAVPPVLQAPAGVFGGLTARFDFAARPAHPWVLVAALGPATHAVQGVPVLQNLSLLSIGTLDAAGIGSWQVPVPPGLGGLVIHTQMIEGDPVQLLLLGSSPVRQVVFFF